MQTDHLVDHKYRNKISETNRVNSLWVKCLLSLFCALFLASCTNSRLLLRPIYNSLDNRISDRILPLAEFTAEQKDDIETLVGQFHVWHRKNELPRYAALIDRIVPFINRPGAVTEGLVKDWTREIQSLVDSSRNCLPTQFAAPVIVSLSDEQVMTIRNRWQERAKKHADERAKELAEMGLLTQGQTPSSGQMNAEERQKKISRYLSLAGFSLSYEQSQELKAEFANRKRYTVKFSSLREHWQEKLFELLESRKETGFEGRLIAYIDQRNQAFRSREPAVREFNIERWQRYTRETIRTLSTDQREFLTGWLSGLASSIRALSRDEPSFKTASEKSTGCLPDSGSV